MKIPQRTRRHRPPETSAFQCPLSDKGHVRPVPSPHHCYFVLFQPLVWFFIDVQSFSNLMALKSWSTFLIILSPIVSYSHVSRFVLISHRWIIPVSTVFAFLKNPPWQHRTSRSIFRLQFWLIFLAPWILVEQSLIRRRIQNVAWHGVNCVLEKFHGKAADFRL